MSPSKVRRLERREIERTIVEHPSRGPVAEALRKALKEKGS